MKLSLATVVKFLQGKYSYFLKSEGREDKHSRYPHVRPAHWKALAALNKTMLGVSRTDTVKKTQPS